MTSSYLNVFGFNSVPFPDNVLPDQILHNDRVETISQRLEYIRHSGGICVITGEVGTGKTTALRATTANWHPSEMIVLWITATQGTIIEVFQQLAWALRLNLTSNKRAFFLKHLRYSLSEIIDKQRQQICICIDEAQLLRLEVFSELHALCQLKPDDGRILPLVLCGQSQLLDRLRFRSSAPIADRVVARVHLEGDDRENIEKYLAHHLSFAGVSKSLFAPQAITAIHQQSSGHYRKINHLARGGLIAAALENCPVVSEAHIERAASELIR